MIFYDCATAPNPRRARMFIAEKGLQIETRQISIAEGEQMSEAFRAVNPRATVPVLITKAGHALTENLAIAAYLEEISPEPNLMGADAEERAQVLMWNAICESQGGLAVGEALRNGNPHMKDRALTGPVNFEQIPALAERGMIRIGLFLDLLEERLQASPYVALDRLTLADISAFVFTDFARVVKMRLDDSRPAALDWYQRMKARPSAAL
jgi:glutathione S-transferase